MIVLPITDASDASAFAMILIQYEGATNNVTGAVASFNITFSRFPFPTTAGIGNFFLREGINGSVARFFPDRLIEFGPAVPYTLGCFAIPPDLAQRIINNPSNFYLEVSVFFPPGLLRGQLGSTPKIANVIRQGKKLIVTGENFRRGAEILLNFAAQDTENDESAPTRVLISRTAGKKISPGDIVTIQVRDPSSLTGNQFRFARE